MKNHQKLLIAGLVVAIFVILGIVCSVDAVSIRSLPSNRVARVIDNEFGIVCYLTQQATRGSQSISCVKIQG